MGKRLPELDSLRGLAALTVLTHHYLDVRVLPDNFIAKLLKIPPFYLVNAGYEAVIFFFILSGFVLALPFLNTKEKISYPGFIIKRICRIYMPYFFAIILAITMVFLFYRGGIAELSYFFNMVGQKPLDKNLIISHIFFIGSFTNYKYDPVLWSLIHEMRISLLFPLIIHFVLKYNWKKSIVIAVFLSMTGFVLSFLINRSANIYDLKYDYFITIQYIGLFIIGILVAKHREYLIRKYTELNKRSKYGLIALTIIVYTNASWLNNIVNNLLQFDGIFKRAESFSLHMMNDFGAAAGVVVFIVIALSSEKVSAILHKKTVHFFGKISYSLYLYHAICLITIFNALYGKMPFWSLIIASFITSIAISSLSYYLVEIPSINLGRYLSKRLELKINSFKKDTIDTSSFNG